MDTAGKKGIGRKHKSREKKGKLQVENIETGTEKMGKSVRYKTLQFCVQNTKCDRHDTDQK